MDHRKLATVALLLSTLLIVINNAFASQKQSKSIPKPSAVLYDVTNKKLLHEQNSQTPISIASMTKLLTVLAVLKADQDLNQVIKVVGREASPRIRTGMAMTRIDLIQLTLVSSDNLAARSLMEHYPNGYASGILAMNTIAKELGATDTTIIEPTGLNAENKSTLIDLIKIVEESSKYELFGRFANRERSEIQAEQVSKAKRFLYWIHGKNTNPFVHEPSQIQILSAKTGLTSAAGWCLAMMFSYGNNQYILVTAGNQTMKHRKQMADMLIERITNYEYRVRINTPDSDEY